MNIETHHWLFGILAIIVAGVGFWCGKRILHTRHKSPPKQPISPQDEIRARNAEAVAKNAQELADFIKLQTEPLETMHRWQRACLQKMMAKSRAELYATLQAPKNPEKKSKSKSKSKSKKTKKTRP